MAHLHAVPRWRLARPRALTSRQRLALIAGVVVVVAGAASGAWALTRPAAAAAYHLFPAVRTTLTQSLSAAGTIEPATASSLSFSADGQVTAVNAIVGEHVTQGQALAVMDSPALHAQVAQAQAGLAQDESQLSGDTGPGVSSAQLAADQAAVSADQSQVRTADQALAGATLTSPIDGIVVSVGYTAGEQTGAAAGGGGGSQASTGGSDGGLDGGSDGGSDGGTGSAGITVVSTGDVINANVDASVVSRIKAGDQVLISTSGAAGVTGTVGSIGLVASASSGVATFPVVIKVTGTPSGLYAGASANVSIIYTRVPAALAVPATAVHDSDGHSVVTVRARGRSVTRRVATGLVSGGLVQVTSGLRSGDLVEVPVRKLTGGSGSGPGSPGKFFFGPGGGVINVRPGRFPGPGVHVIGPGGG